MAASHWFVMSLDAHAAHITPCVFEAACRAGGFINGYTSFHDAYPPAIGYTHFSGLKLELWKGTQTLTLESASGDFQIERFMDVLCDVIGRVMSKAYPHAFASCGFSRKQQGLTERMLNALEWSEVPDVGSEPPTLQELQLLWRQGKTIPIMSAF